MVVGVAGALPAAALHPQGFFVTNRALELAEARDVLPLALGLIAIGADLATDPRGCHHLSKFVDLLVRPAACLLLEKGVRVTVVALFGPQATPPPKAPSCAVPGSRFDQFLWPF